MVAWTPRSSPKPFRKRSVTRSSSFTDPDSIGSVDARAVRPAASSAVAPCWNVPKANSLHLANSLDQLGGRRIALRFCVDCRHRGFEWFAVEVGHDRDAGRFRPLARLVLEVFPFLAHELAG